MVLYPFEVGYATPKDAFVHSYLKTIGPEWSMEVVTVHSMNRVQ